MVTHKSNAIWVFQKRERWENAGNRSQAPFWNPKWWLPVLWKWFETHAILVFLEWDRWVDAVNRNHTPSWIREGFKWFSQTGGCHLGLQNGIRHRFLFFGPAPKISILYGLILGLKKWVSNFHKTKDVILESVFRISKWRQIYFRHLIINFVPKNPLFHIFWKSTS